MGRYRAGIETRDRILDATRTLLGESGLDGTTLKAICDRADVRAGSFYNLFSSKDEAIIEVVKEAIAAVDPDPEHVGKDTVADLVEAYISFIGFNPMLAQIYIQMFSASALTDDATAARMLRHHRNRVQRFADAWRREQPATTSAEAHAHAEILVAALNGLAFQSTLDPSVDFASLARRLLAGQLTRP